eukprot:gene16959-20149_t
MDASNAPSASHEHLTGAEKGKVVKMHDGGDGDGGDNGNDDDSMYAKPLHGAAFSQIRLQSLSE